MIGNRCTAVMSELGHQRELPQRTIGTRFTSISRHSCAA
jgi:hypothetical protein